MRHYEIKRFGFVIDNKEINKEIREKAFNNLVPTNSEEKLEILHKNQQNFINSLRESMTEDRVFSEVAAYRDKVMVVIAVPDNENAYVAIFFDKERTDKRYKIQMDKDKLYIEDGE